MNVTEALKYFVLFWFAILSLSVAICIGIGMAHHVGYI
jgi:hypothetical protein